MEYSKRYHEVAKHKVFYDEQTNTQIVKSCYSCPFGEGSAIPSGCNHPMSGLESCGRLQYHQDRGIPNFCPLQRGSITITLANGGGHE